MKNEQETKENLLFLNFFFCRFKKEKHFYSLFHLSYSMRKVCGCCWIYTSQRKYMTKKTNEHSDVCVCVTWAKLCLGITHSLSLISWPTFEVKYEKEWLNCWFSLISLFRCCGPAATICKTLWTTSEKWVCVCVFNLITRFLFSWHFSLMDMITQTTNTNNRIYSLCAFFFHVFTVHSEEKNL